jgi:tRNA threonylcarbamoyladenosine biosynthesis protein TsaE
MERIFTLSTLKSLAEECWAIYGNRPVFSFSGQLGAGKTTLIRALCEVKGVKDRVSSPTFSLINEYRYPGGIIYHIDLYRINDEAEAVRAGIEDVLHSGEICLLEWPEKAPGILPPETVHFHIEVLDAARRKITVAG